MSYIDFQAMTTDRLDAYRGGGSSPPLSGIPLKPGSNALVLGYVAEDTGAILVTISQYEGRERVDVRLWNWRKRAEDFAPTPLGVQLELSS